MRQPLFLFFSLLSAGGYILLINGNIPISKLSLKPLLGHQRSLLSHSFSEQRLDDINNQLSRQNLLQRRLFILPLTTEYIPSRYHSLYEKEQYCDKCSLPKSLGSEIERLSEQITGPCTWEMRRYKPEGEDWSSSEYDGRDEDGLLMKDKIREEDHQKQSEEKKSRVYVTSLDYRAPENYLYVPQWIMRSLRVSSFDQIELKYVQLSPVSRVTLRPLTPTWRRLTSGRYSSKDLREIIENQLSSYTTLTVKTKIPVCVNSDVLEFEVAECQDRRGVCVDGVLIQDQDVETVIDDSLLPPPSRLP
jgi:ubiquitin fusion degradation protein 1